ncbi:MAG: hypothetical protein MZV49_14125 [Rhodopseudomonas palustris]|nr:hypothetical protein [Rhodopseudomonas palustris]
MDSFDYLSLLVVDIQGALRSVSLPRAYVSEKVLKDGIGFDASNFGYRPGPRERHGRDARPVHRASSRSARSSGSSTPSATSGPPTASPSRSIPRAVARRAVEHLRASGDRRRQPRCSWSWSSTSSTTSATHTTVDHSYYFVESAEGIGDELRGRAALRPVQGLPPHGARTTSTACSATEAVRAMEEAGIPVKYHHHEVGGLPARDRAELHAPARAPRDAVVLSKWIIKSMADELGLYVTFMPKPMYKIAGSGMHVHQFVEKGGKSIFPGEGLYGLSEAGLAYTAGVLSHALSGSLLAWSNPSTNSYRRLVPGYEAPVSATFAQGSRAAAVRIPGYLKKGEARIEFRTGDATANTYYFLAAMLLAGPGRRARGTWTP